MAARQHKRRRNMRKNIIKMIFVSFLAVFAISCGNQDANKKAEAQEGQAHEHNTTKAMLAEGLVVEAACGECMFGLEGEGCDLAVRIDGHAYFVDGTKIDEHGDAHAEDGFCSLVRKAKVKGEIKDGRFVAESFELLPVEEAHDHDHDAVHEHDDDSAHEHDAKEEHSEAGEHEGHDHN